MTGIVTNLPSDTILGTDGTPVRQKKKTVFFSSTALSFPLNSLLLAANIL